MANSTAVLGAVAGGIGLLLLTRKAKASPGEGGNAAGDTIEERLANFQVFPNTLITQTFPDGHRETWRVLSAPDSGFQIQNGEHQGRFEVVETGHLVFGGQWLGSAQLRTMLANWMAAALNLGFSGQYTIDITDQDTVRLATCTIAGGCV